MDSKKEIVFEMIEITAKHKQATDVNDNGKMLVSRLRDFGVRITRVNVGTGLCLTILTVLGIVVIESLLDWMLDLDLIIRAVFLTANLIILSYLLYKKVLNHLIYKKDQEELALIVERHFPIFKDRLISSIQLMKINPESEGISSAMLKSLIKETGQIARPINFTSIVDIKPFIKLASLTVLTLLVFLIVCVNYQEVAVPLLKRLALFNEDIPRKTKVEVITGDKVIGRGDPIRISAMAKGIIPTTGDLIVTYDSGRTVKYTMEKNETNKSVFSIELENVQDSFKYRIKIFDGVSKEHNVKVVPRPQVAFLECLEEFPKYTGLSPVLRKPGDLGLLAGSVLHLKITATKDVKSAFVRLAGMETNIAGIINQTNRKVINASIKIPTNKLVGFSLDLIDEYGISSKDQTLYRIDIIPDKPPSVKITYPQRREELYTRLAKALIGFEASDDYGLSAIKLHYKIEDNNKSMQNVIEFDVGGERQNFFRRRFEWDLSKLNPPAQEGATIEYWIEVIDNNDETGKGVGYSERFIARIVSEAEKRADLMNRVTEYIDNLENVALEQEKLSKSLGEIILEKVKN